MMSESLKLKSSAFSEGQKIPDKYGYTAENVNPPLEIEGVPPEAESLVLIMDDPNAFNEPSKAWDHWIVWNIPPNTSKIPEGVIPSESEEGKTDFGDTSYGGPNPPDDEHTYRFKIYALDTTLDLPSDSTGDAVENSMEGNIISQARWPGTYAPWHGRS